MDKQKIFNRVAKHLLKQGRKSINPYLVNDTSQAFLGSDCAYRTYDPNTRKVLKCAIGCLIPFQAYTPEIEGKSVSSDAVANILADLGIAGHMSDGYYGVYDFLCQLQSVHDGASDGDGFLPDVIRGLLCVADEHCLDASVLKEHVE